MGIDDEEEEKVEDGMAETSMLPIDDNGIGGIRSEAADMDEHGPCGSVAAVETLVWTSAGAAEAAEAAGAAGGKGGLDVIAG
jgi:hypothetical protein